MTKASRPSKMSDDEMLDAESSAGAGIADAVEPVDEDDDGSLPDFEDDKLDDWDDDEEDDYAMGNDFSGDEDLD